MKNGARKALLPLGDILMLFIAFFAMLQVAFPDNLSSSVIDAHLLPFLIIFGIWIVVFFLFNLYDAKSVKPTISNLQKIGAAYVVALACSIILFYTVSYFGITPKTNLLIFSVVFIILFVAWRRIFYKIFSNYFRKSVAFITEKERDMGASEELIGYMENYPQSGFLFKGIYSSLEDLMAKTNLKDLNMLIVSKDKLHDGRETEIIYNTVKEIFDLSYAYEEILGKIPVDSIDETWFLYNIRNTDKALYNTLAGALNLLAAVFGLVITSPLLVIVAVCIKLGDSGPIFYAQERIGRNGKIFKLYKFRSMIPGADKSGAEWTENNDHRITRVGKIIRKLHIDEVPQLLNVLLGDMALVGPRPEIPSFAEKLSEEIPHYNLRHIIIPGFTGWAQIKFRNARGVEESKEKFKYDLYYIKNRNLFMDLGIILRTIQIVFTHN